jgi:hypothetical protein
MQETSVLLPKASPHPPVWPKVIIGTVTVFVVTIWLCVWIGWLPRDWGFWALSSAALVIAIMVGIWRTIPGGEPPASE